MATGVLLILVGSCTKLSQFLTLDEKSYLATVRLGTGTDTLDAEGRVVEQHPVPRRIVEALEAHGQGEGPVAPAPWEAALRREQERAMQVPPDHSAIKQQGQAAYVRARKGQHVHLPPRPVRVTGLAVVGATADPPDLTLSVTVSKGYYVRALARDLGEGLSVPAHLTSLRRTSSGPFTLAGAVTMQATAETVREALRPLEQVARAAMPGAQLTWDGALRTLQGKRLTGADFVEPMGWEGPTAWFAPNGRLVAVGHLNDSTPVVQRAFLHTSQLC
jgi:tRNA pseudouridine55 synthase